MNTKFDLFMDLFVLSGGFWMLYGLYCIFSIRRFIVKRYEKETNLMDTVFFKEHFTFTRFMPGFLSSGLYGSHLMMCIWWWGFYGKKKIFRDIDNPEQVTRLFTAKEIRRVKRMEIAIYIVILHFISIFIFKFIWPETFN